MLFTKCHFEIDRENEWANDLAIRIPRSVSTTISVAHSPVQFPQLPASVNVKVPLIQFEINNTGGTGYLTIFWKSS